MAPEADRRLRYYYVRLFSGGRAEQTSKLTRRDAAWVIAWLERLSRRAIPGERQAAGTAGRAGFRSADGYVQMPRFHRGRSGGLPRRWDMDRQQVERFIANLPRFHRGRYSGVGLRGTANLRTMADLNRVLWGLKAMLRRNPRRKHVSPRPLSRA